MENATYAGLTRQSGLWSELRVVANNIANSSTTGYRQEGLTFSEHVSRTGTGEPSLSMARAMARHTSMLQGGHTQTGGSFDLAIQGEGFFQIETPDGVRLTRAGAFGPNAEGDLVTPEGYPVLDAGGAPVFVPPDANTISIAADGTIAADGNPIGQIGLVIPDDPLSLRREDGVRFNFDGNTAPAENASMLQGFLESSNVDPVSQIARLIEVQRAYELGQKFLDKEDERIRTTIQALSRR